MVGVFLQQAWRLEPLQPVPCQDDSHVMGRLGPHSGQRFYHEGVFEARTVNFIRESDCCRAAAGVSDCCRLTRLLLVVY